jgi:hypothetical protein
MNESPHSVGEQSERSESPSLLSTSAGKTSRALPKNQRDFRREFDRRLGLLRREINSLKARARTVTRKSRTEYLELLEALERKATGLERRVDRFVDGCGESWESFRTKTEETFRDLKQTLQRVALSFRQRHPGSKADSEEERPRR